MCDEPLFEAIVAATKKAATPAKAYENAQANARFLGAPGLGSPHTIPYSHDGIHDARDFTRSVSARSSRSIESTEPDIEVGDNVTQGVAGDVMQMPPSWGELLTAVHEAAFPDGDEEPEPITVPEPVADVLRGIAEQMATGARVVFVETDRGFAAGAKAQREADHRLLMSQGESFPAGILHSRPLVTDTGDTVTDDSDDTDDDTTVTSGIEAVKSLAFAEGWGDGYAEGHAAGYRDAVLGFTDGGEA